MLKNTTNESTKLQDGYRLLTLKNLCFSVDELAAIEKLTEQVKYEAVTNGDAGDMHKLMVGRFRRDITIPTDLTSLSNDLMKIINSEKAQAFYRNLTGYSNVCIRRAQANILNPGDYVGIHIDGKGDAKYKGTHEDYKYAIVLHFGESYEGGDTILYYKNNIKKIRLPKYSMLITEGYLPHSVETVTAGQRKTLAYFLSDNFGPSSDA